MNDVIEYIGESIVQHGKYNDRIYLMSLSNNDYPKILEKLDKIARALNYSKIFAKVPGYARDSFIYNGYVMEAFIPRFYNYNEDACFMSKFFSESRETQSNSNKINEVIEKAKLKKDVDLYVKLEPTCRLKIIEPSECYQLAEIYKMVFRTYPFPIFDSEYLLITMRQNVIYFGIWDKSRLVAVSSAEMDISGWNAEMTDFAVLPDYRGENFAGHLLKVMEGEMRKNSIKTVYTIARATSYGMNITFAKQGYQYSGTLINNTNICGNFESMNVWYKHLQ